jgi:hypothetical protein
LLLRLLPCLRDPGFEYVVDASYHERLTRDVVESGRLPPIDRLSGAPEGRRTAQHLPIGIYFAGGAADRVLSAIGSRELRWNLALFTALAGALIALPIWLGVRALGGGSTAAALAALLGVLLPAHLQRTFGYCLRYDALGALLTALHAALSLRALTATEVRSRWVLAAAAALALIGALWTWRVSMLVLNLECLATAIWLVLRGTTPAHKTLWAAIVVIGTLGLMPVSYLTSHEYLLSGPWLAVVALAVASRLPMLDSRRPWTLRLAVLMVLAVLAAVVGRPDRTGDYANLTAMAASRLGLTRHEGPLAALMLDVQELRGLSPLSLLFDPNQLVLMGVWALATPLILWLAAGRPRLGVWLTSTPEGAFLATVTAGLAVGTVSFERTGVLLAPFVAMAVGVLSERLISSSATAPSAQRGSKAPWNPNVRITLAVLLVLTTVTTGVAAVRRSSTAWAKLDPTEAGALAWLRVHSAPGDVVLCDWDAGYDVQARTGLATRVDGLLESAENRRRIIELYGAFMAASPESLRQLCLRCRARWLLVPPGPAIPAMAHVIGDPLWDAVARGERISSGPMMNHTIVHLIGNDVDVRGFRRVFTTTGPFQVYEFVADSVGENPAR